MRKEYDLSKLALHPNPIFAKLSKEITLRVGLDAIAYFDALAEETGVDASTLMAVYLRECAINRHRPTWGLVHRKRSGDK